MKQFDESYQKVVDNLKKQFYASSHDSEKMKQFQDLKEKYSKLRAELKSLKNSFLTTKNELSKDFEKYKIQKSRLLEEYSKEYNEYMNQNNEIIQKLENIENSIKEDQDSLQSSFHTLKEKNHIEITEKQSQLAQMIHDHKNELEKKSNLIQSDAKLSNEEFDYLKSQLLKEFEQLRTQNETIYPPIIEKNKQLQKSLDDLLKSNSIEKEQYVNQLGTQKNEHLNEMNKLKEENDDEEHLEYARFESKMATLHKKLGQTQSLLSDSEFAQENKNKLENELNELKLFIGKSKSEFEQTFNEEKQNLTNENDTDFQKVKEEEEKAFADFQKQLENEINDNQNDFENKKTNLTKNLKNSYESCLSSIPEQFKNDGVIPNLLNDYTRQMKALNDQLAFEMQEIKKDSNEGLFKDTISSKQQKITEIENDRNSTIKNQNAEIENENDRHIKLLLTFSFEHLDKELNELRENVHQKIENWTQQHDELLLTLRKLTESNPDIISVSGFLEDEEIINLRKYLEEIRENLKKQRQHKQTEMEAALTEKAEEIEKTTEQIKQNKINEIQNQKDEKARKEKEFEEMKNLEIVKKKDLDLIYNKELISHDSTIAKIKEDYKKKIQEIADIIRKDKIGLIHKQTELNKEADLLRIEIEKKTDGAVDKFQKEIAEMIKIKENYLKKMEKYLKESEERCNEAKHKAENIPMRKDECDAIKRLEEILEQKTQQLTIIAKDLMGYRNRLKQQEDEYNRRFGVAPQVAILHGGGNGRSQAKSAMVLKKPLPPLKNSLVC
ncbi:hypothetical protein TRFO_10123 [Tritrichomonas foetus]|uniref:Uncharacterized protein n=1 Tax=Tritrichomonas foetus TaxID=1144522 RepID=A0A1J4JAL2_9EUKA|nr:hypothetical protein TRFO_10123 [Tritrichomonas foetus]|eukprot:OHS96192.1 hypothetical protein TRFO_10123 [Tritrichomonas foetus]